MGRTIARRKNETVTEAKVNGTPVEQPPQSPPTETRQPKYAKVEVFEYSTAVERGGLTADDMHDMLGWETEPEYTQRMLKENPNNKVADFLFYDDYHCYDTYGDKVRCHKNAGNRPFDMDWCNQIAEMILQGLYAGPFTIPGGTINGETIRISMYEDMLSGQHQGTALKIAQQKLDRSRNLDRDGKYNPEVNDKNPYYNAQDPSTEMYPFWTGHKKLFIETLVVTGISPDERVLRTIDYVKQRTMADVLYTMPLYRKNSPPERKEMTRMLSSAIELLWDRTCAQGYRTHPEFVNFLERHRTLLECTEHLFLENKPVSIPKPVKGENESDQEFEERKERAKKEQLAQGGRRISKRRLSAGQCAALEYLMRVSAVDDTESENYRHMQPPKEDVLDFSMTERAKLFWEKLAGSREFLPVRTKLDQLIVTDKEAEELDKLGLGGRSEEKMAVLCKAWDIFKTHPLDDPENPPFPYTINQETGEVESEDIEPGGALSLSYTGRGPNGEPLPDAKVKLEDPIDFKGIDCPGEKQKNGSPTRQPDPPEEAIYGNGGLTEQIRQEREQKEKQKEEEKKTRKKPIKRK